MSQNNDIATALSGLESLIDAQVTARVEAALATERAAIAAQIDNAVSAALSAVRAHLVTAQGALDNAVEATK